MRKAFTMVELVIVMTIIALMAGFGVPSFTKAMNRSRARDAILKLNAIHATNVLFRARNNNTNFTGNLAAINNSTTGLGLNIVANGVVYNCSLVGIAYQCTATGTGFVATAQLDQNLSATNPSCAGASCP